jgi:outer membrane protein
MTQESSMVLTLLALTMTSTMTAASPPRPIRELEPGHVYSLDELTRIGLINQPRLKAAAAAEQAARERKGEAEAPNYPTVSAYAEYVRATFNNSVSAYIGLPGMTAIGGFTSVDEKQLPTLANVTAPPPTLGSAAGNDSYLGAVIAQYNVLDFGRTSNSIRTAEAGIDLAHSDTTVAAEAIVFGVRKAYYGLLAAQSLLTTAQKTVAEAKEHFDWAQEAVKDGLRAPVDELQAKADVTKANLTLVQAEASVRVAHVRILQAIGVEKVSEIAVAPAPVVSDSAETEESLLDQAFKQRPDLASKVAAVQVAEAQLSRAKAEFYPYLNAVAGVEVMGADPSLPTSLSVVPDWDVGLVLGVPIFEGFLTTHHVREADAKVTVQREQEEDLRLTIVEQVREAFVDFKSSLEAVIAADANQVAAEEELKVISGRYNNGLGSILDLIIAQATTVTAEDEAVRARYQSGVARSVLELAIGAPPPSLPAPNQP